MREAFTAILCGAALAACDPAGSTLVVQVRTNLAPGIEFASVRTTLDVRTMSIATTETRDWGVGVRIAELALAEGTYQLDVAALDANGEEVVSRPVRVELSPGVTVVTVLLTRDCRGVVCPGDADDPGAVACVAGRCMDESCVEEVAGTCDPPACTAAAECPAPTGGCAVAECSPSGSCFVTLQHAECAQGDVCDDLTGACAPADVALREFGPARLVEGLVDDTSHNEDPTLSVDGLEIFFVRGVSIWTSTRRTRASAWDPPTRVEELLDAGGNPSLSRDGRTLYFAAVDQLSAVTRPAPGAPWGSATMIWDRTTTDCPSPTADHLELYFCTFLGVPEGGQIATLTRGSEAERFGMDTIVPSLAGAGDDAMPFARIPGGRVLYFTSRRDGPERALFRTTRAGAGAPFNAPVRLAELDEMGTAQEDPWVSDDERWIVFTSDRLGNKALFEAFR